MCVFVCTKITSVIPSLISANHKINKIRAITLSAAAHIKWPAPKTVAINIQSRCGAVLVMLFLCVLYVRITRTADVADKHTHTISQECGFGSEGDRRTLCICRITRHHRQTTLCRCRIRNLNLLGRGEGVDCI